MTSVDFPAPVSPTIATVVPAGIFRLKWESTFSVPSGYRKDTSLNSISPLIGSQFSRLGRKASPYFEMTSGLSVIVSFCSSRPETRSMLAWVLMTSARVLANCWIGSKMPIA